MIKIIFLLSTPIPMESQFWQKTKSKQIQSTQVSLWYGWKSKTGTKKTKTKSPKIKAIKPMTVTGERKARKPTVRMDRVPSSKNTEIQRHWDESIPTWVRESSEKKLNRKEWEESKLQWRKETKKSQRSFSKNKEREYTQNKSKTETYTEDSRKPFWNSFQKNEWETSLERKSSWDKNSVKPGTGFKKSKTGYKWVGSVWDKSAIPHVTTRKWDTDTEKMEKSKNDWKIGAYKWKNLLWEKSKNSDIAPRTISRENKNDFSKPSFKKDTPATPKSLDKKQKYTIPKPTWESESKIIDKKTLIDPTK
jgi:hypothetical protein